MESTNTDRNFRKRGSMSLAIYNKNFRELTSILNTLHAVFDREDEAARNINEWSSTIPQYIGIRFGTVSVGFSDGPAPEETEGGNQNAIFNIRFEYYVDHDVKTFQPVFTPGVGYSGVWD